MAKKNSRSDNSASSKRQPAPERRRTARATTRNTTRPDTIVTEPDGSPAVGLETANDMPDDGPGTPTAQAPTYEQIAEAAYHRYLARGGQDGRDFDDWLDAERSLLGR